MFISKEENNKHREKLLQHERIAKSKEIQKASEIRKLNNHLKFIVGGLVIKHFPDISKIKPQKTKLDNEKEFANLDKTLEYLSTNDEFIKFLKQGLEL